MKKRKSWKEKFPEVASQWHPTKNGELTPDQVALWSNKEVWWLQPYDDPVTGKHFEFEWKARIANRTIKEAGCPFLSNQAVWPGYNDLATRYPEIAAQWHPTKNEGLTPDQVTLGSNIKVWWYLPYDDPVTGKHFEFEWKATICNRTIGKTECPFLSNQAVWPGYNDLATRYPEVAAQWHPAKNEGLTPDQVTFGSNIKVWWYLPYDDPVTGKHFEFEWKAKIVDRVTRGHGCPYLSNIAPAVWPGYNDLATRYPEIAAQWHPTKNGALTPAQVTLGSNIKVWWYLPYDDPVTGKHFEFEWKATICNRTIGKTECPFLSNQAAWPGYNDLATQYPEIAAQWHPTKNGTLAPTQVTPGSDIKVWWLQPYDDPVTGKHFEFEWEARIRSRIYQERGCPYISNQAVWPGYNDLATRYPEVAAQWHPAKNEGLTPDQVTFGSNIKVWWYLPYDDPVTGKHFEFEWKARIVNRVTLGYGCPYLSNKAVWPGYNDLATRYPEIAAQWHPTKNGTLTPTQVTAGSHIKVWWYLPYDDPVTGKHFDFEWKACIGDRQETGCPYLSNKAVWPGYNDLATRYPEVAAQWHPAKNEGLTPDQVTFGSNIKVWWYLPYDDPVTGKHFEFEWKARIADRIIHESGCPFLLGAMVWSGYNDLATRYPEIAALWHPTKNNGRTPDMVFAGGNQWAWWSFPYDDPESGRHFDFEWGAQVQTMIRNPACPYLTNMKVWPGYNDLKTSFPEIASEWHPKRNRTTPDKVMKYAHKKVWWKCKDGHEWYTYIDSRTRVGRNCPKCDKLRRRHGNWTT